MATVRTPSQFESRVVERKDGRRGERYRDPGGDLEEIAGELSRVVGGPAGGEHDQPGRVGGNPLPEPLEIAQFRAQGFVEGGRLLPDLGEHL